MAVRTVTVRLTGTVTPYTTAMRTAARATTQTASQISTSMRQAALRGQAAMTAMGRGAQAQAARVGAGMSSLAARTAAAMRAAAAPFPGITSRASAGFTRLGAVGRAVAGAISTRMAAAAAGVSARWSAASAAVARSMSSMRLAAYAAGAGVLSMANNSRRSLELVRNASVALVAAFALAAAAAARFDKSMSEVRAVTGGSAADMNKLKQAALDAGQATIYSATEAAKAEAELARAGISTADIIGGALKGSLDLAASGQLELGEAAIISAQAMNSFKLEGGDVGHIADVISAGAGKSATNVHDMGMAFRQAALLSSQTGLSLEQTVGTLSLFAQNALTGSDAGTSLKVMLQRLVPQSKEAQAAMDAIGFSAYDAQGNFIGLSALSDVMKNSFSKLTPEARSAAMATIFGSDAVRGATILYEAGAKGVDKWVRAVDDTGYATRVAATMTDNLSGDLERLKGALETALIQSGSSANGVLRNMAQALTAVVGWYSRLSPGVQSNVTVMAGFLGVIGLIGSGLMLMLPRIMLVRRELAELGVTATRARGAMLTLARAGVVVAGLMAISYAAEKVREAFADAPPSVAKLGAAMVDFARQGKVGGEIAKQFGNDLDGFSEAVNRIAHPDWKARTTDITNSVTFDLTKGLMEAQIPLDEAHDKIRAVDAALAGLAQSGATKEAAASFKQFAEQAEAGGTSTEKLMTLLPQYSEALATTDTQNKLTAGSQKQLGDAASMTADQIKDERTEAEKLTEALDILNGAAISAAEKEISFRGSLADLTAAVKENGHSLDVTSDSGRKVKSAFLDAAQAAMTHAEAVAEQKGSVAAGNAVLEADVSVLKRVMHQAGFTDSQIRQLTSSYLQLPGAKKTTVTAPGALKTAAELQTIKDKIATTKSKTVEVKALTAEGQRALEALGFKIDRTKGKTIRITAPTGSAQAQIAALKAAIDRLRSKSVTITTVHHTVESITRRPTQGEGNLSKYARGGLVRYASGGLIAGYPGGGLIEGPGTGTSDSILARVSNGEFVIKEAAVRRYGAGLFEQLNALRMPATGAATGGLISGIRLAGSSQPQPTAAAMRALIAHVSASNGLTDGQRLRLVVGGREFDAYVDTRAAGQVQRSNSQLVQVLNAGGGI